MLNLVGVSLRLRAVARFLSCTFPGSERALLQFLAPLHRAHPPILVMLLLLLNLLIDGAVFRFSGATALELGAFGGQSGIPFKALSFVFEGFAGCVEPVVAFAGKPSGRVSSNRCRSA